MTGLRTVFIILVQLAVVQINGASSAMTPSLMTVTPADEETPFQTLSDKQIIDLTRSRGFLPLERALQEDVQAAKRIDDAALLRNRLIALARFYTANDLHEESFAIVQDFDWNSPQLRSTAIANLYAMRRFSDVIKEENTAIADPTLAAYVAKAHAQLGAFREAVKIFNRLEPADLDPEAAFFAALAALESGDAALAGSYAALATHFEDNPHILAGFSWLNFEIASAKGAGQQDQLASVYLTDLSPWVEIATVSELARSETLQDFDLQKLQLRSDNRLFQQRIAALSLKQIRQRNDLMRLAVVLRDIINRFPESNLARQSGEEMRALLPKLLAPGTSISALEAAKLFYENIEFAPPGEDGDTLIRHVAEKLVSLGLVDAATELLEHQVFNRLRGAERSRVAAALADIYLTEQRSGEALRVLRSTRMAGLSDEVNARRRVIEARALNQSDQFEEAIQLLAGAKTFPEIRLRADLHWTRQEWALAAASYQDAMMIVEKEEQANLSLRAGVSLLKSGDPASLKAFLDQYKDDIGQSNEFQFLTSLYESRQEEQGLATSDETFRRLMMQYQGLFDANAASASWVN